MHRLHDYNVDLPAHTYGRNRNSVALSCACMGGVPDPWTQPPTDSQLNSLCAEAAAVARTWGWGADQITVERVMTMLKQPPTATVIGCTTTMDR